jgi:hypothetical protein
MEKTHGGVSTAARIALDVVVAFAVLLVVTVGVAIFGVVEERGRVATRWSSLK